MDEKRQLANPVCQKDQRCQVIDWTKPIQTRDGRPAKFLHRLTGAGPRDCIATVVTNPSGVEALFLHSEDGSFIGARQSQSDIINIPAAPKLRPWRPEEVPLNAAFKFKESGTITVGFNLRFERNEIQLCNDKIHQSRTFQELMDGWDHSTDGGVTWKPCGVEE